MVQVRVGVRVDDPLRLLDRLERRHLDFGPRRRCIRKISFKNLQCFGVGILTICAHVTGRARPGGAEAAATEVVEPDHPRLFNRLERRGARRRRGRRCRTRTRPSHHLLVPVRSPPRAPPKSCAENRP